MDMSFKVGNDEKVDTVKIIEGEQSVQQEQGGPQNLDGASKSEDEEKSATGTTHANINDEPTRQEQSQGPDRVLGPTHSEHDASNALQSPRVGVYGGYTTTKSQSEPQDEAQTYTEAQQVGDVQMADPNPGDFILTHHPDVGNEPKGGVQALDFSNQRQTVPSSPLPIYAHGSEGRNDHATGHEESQSEPSSDTIFMQRISTHFRDHNRKSNQGHTQHEPAPSTLSNETVGHYEQVDERKERQGEHLHLARPAQFAGGLRDGDMTHNEKANTKKLLSDISDEHMSQPYAKHSENVHRSGFSHGPYDRVLWEGQQWEGGFQQPGYHLPQGSSLMAPGSITHYRVERSCSLPQPTIRNSIEDAYGMQPHTSHSTQGSPEHSYEPAPSASQVYEMPGNQTHRHRVAAPSPHGQVPYAIPSKRDYVEDSEEEAEEVDEYEPSESGDDEDSDTGSEDDLPLKDRQDVGKSCAQSRRPAMRSGSDSQSEYQDEDGEDQDDEDDDEEESEDTNEDERASGKKHTEPIRHISIDTRSPTQSPDGNATDPAPSLTTSSTLPDTLAGPAAIQRALPVLQPQPSEVPSPDEISFKLPQYHVEVTPLKTKDDLPEVRVNLPGMPREQLILTPDHAHQEIHLLRHLFMPGQQALATPDPEPMLALLNFHTVATLVLEAYTSYEVGDLEARPSGPSKTKEKNDTEALDATKDEIFFAVMDRWRVGLAEETLRPSYKCIRGVQEFCDIALDVIYYLEEHGFVEGPQTMRKERNDKGVKRAKKNKDEGKKAAVRGSEESETSEESRPNKIGKPRKRDSESQGEVTMLQARKKAKATPKATPKKQANVAKKPKISVIPRKK